MAKDRLIEPSGKVTQPQYENTRDAIRSLVGQHGVNPGYLDCAFGLARKGERESGCSLNNSDVVIIEGKE